MKTHKTSILKLIILSISLFFLYLLIFWLNPTMLEYKTLNTEISTFLNLIKTALYLSSVPFYLGAYYLYKLIRIIEKDEFFSFDAIKYFVNIKIVSTIEILTYSIILTLAIINNINIFTLISLLVIFICFVIIIFIEIIIQLLNKAVDIKLENDLTV